MKGGGGGEGNIPKTVLIESDVLTAVSLLMGVSKHSGTFENLVFPLQI